MTKPIDADTDVNDATGRPGRFGLQSLKPLGCLLVPLVFVAPFVLLPLVAFVLGVVFAGPWALLVEVHDNPLQQIGIFVLALVLHFVSVRLYARQVLAVMRKRVGAVRERAARQSPPDVTAPNESPGNQTLRSSELRFETYGQDAERLIDTDVERFVRDRLLNRRGKTLFHAVLVGLLLSLATQFVLTFVFPIWGPPSEADVSPAENASLLMWLQPIVPALVAGGVALLVHRQHFGVGIPTAIFAGVCANVLWVAIAFAMRWGDAGPDDVTLPGVLLAPLGVYAVAVTLGGIAAQRHARQSGGAELAGRRLLVLRVFGVDRNTQSLFGFIVRRWPFLGPIVTIVDPTYASFVFSRARFYLLLAAALPSLVLLALIGDIETLWLHTSLTTATYYVCWLPLMFGWMLWRVRGSTGHNITALRQRLEFEKKSLFQQRHPAIRLVCFDDLWKSALEELVGWADVILMDLRGFSAERRGAGYELAYLMNHWPLSRTLFLLDGTTDTRLFHARLHEQFAAVCPDSPNAGHREVVVHSYAATRSGRELGREMRPILAVLGELATSSDACGTQASERARRRDAADVHTMTRVVTRAIQVSWLVVAAGIALQLMFAWDGMILGSGLSIIWLGAIGVLLATRMRQVLIRYGTLAGIFGNWLWTSAFLFVAVGWLVWYAWIPLQN